MNNQVILGSLQYLSLSSVIVWFVFAILMGTSIQDYPKDNANTIPPHIVEQRFWQTSISFQAVIATAVLYIAFKN